MHGFHHEDRKDFLLIEATLALGIFIIICAVVATIAERL